MMRTMRGIAPWIMLIVAVSFVGWLVFDFGMDITGQGSATFSDVVRVNGHKIDLDTYNQAIRNAREQQQLAGGALPVTLEDQRALEDAVLEQLISDILLQDEYNRRGITTSDEEVRQAILNVPPAGILRDPQFQTDSQFDMTKYQAFLRSGLDPAFIFALEARYRSEIPGQKLSQQLMEDVYVSDARLWRMYQDENDSVTAQVLTLLPQAVARESDIELTDEDISQHYRAHQEDFKRPARAFLSFVMIERVPNAADTAAAMSRANEIRQEILDGTDFALVAARESADSATRDAGGDLGQVRLGQLVAPFEEAALKLRPEQLSEPALSSFGYHVIKLKSKQDSTYEAQHILIPIELQGEHLETVDRRVDSLDLLAAEQDDPSVFDDVAADLGLIIGSTDPVYSGDRMVLHGRLVPDVGLWAFEASPGQTSPVIEGYQGDFLFRLDSINPAGVPPLEEVRDLVARATLAEKQRERAGAIAQDIAGQIRQGTSLARAAISFGVQPRQLGPFTRLNPGPVLTEAPLALGAAFGLAVDQAGGPYEGEQAIYFVRPVARQRPDSAAFVGQLDEMRNRVLQVARQARLQLVMASLRESASIVDRRREVERAIRDLPDTPLPRQPVGF